MIRGPKIAAETREKLQDERWLDYHYHELRMSQKQIAALLHVGQASVNRAMRTLGITARGPGQRKLHSAWQEESHQVAYVLGLILSDGSVESRGHQRLIAISLQRRDKRLLEELCRYFGGYVRDHRTPGFGTGISLQTRWRVCSKELIEHLQARFSIHPGRKSKDMPPIPEISSDLHSHFCRGFFDGDGSIYFRNRCSWRPRHPTSLVPIYSPTIQIASADEHWLTQLDALFPESGNIYRKCEGQWHNQYTGRRAMINLNWMWSRGVGFHLRRKWKKYATVITQERR